MTPDDVAARIYDTCVGLSRGQHGLVLPATPLILAVQIICDIIASDGMDEHIFAPADLAEIVASIVERVRPLMADDAWRTTALDDTATEILRHTEHMLIRLEKEAQPDA